MIFVIIIALFLFIYLCCEYIVRFGIYNPHLISPDKVKPFAIAGVMSGIAVIAFSIVMSIVII